MTETDGRLIGVTPHEHDEQLRDQTHADYKVLVKNDFADFLKTPTLASLRDLVSELLSYQDSHLLGTRRKARGT